MRPHSETEAHMPSARSSTEPLVHTFPLKKYTRAAQKLQECEREIRDLKLEKQRLRAYAEAAASREFGAYQHGAVLQQMANEIVQKREKASNKLEAKPPSTHHFEQLRRGQLLGLVHKWENLHLECASKLRQATACLQDVQAERNRYERKVAAVELRLQQVVARKRWLDGMP